MIREWQARIKDKVPSSISLLIGKLSRTRLGLFFSTVPYYLITGFLIGAGWFIFLPSLTGLEPGPSPHSAARNRKGRGRNHVEYRAIMETCVANYRLSVSSHYLWKPRPREGGDGGRVVEQLEIQIVFQCELPSTSMRALLEWHLLWTRRIRTRGGRRRRGRGGRRKRGKKRRKEKRTCPFPSMSRLWCVNLTSLSVSLDEHFSVVSLFFLPAAFIIFNPISLCDVPLGSEGIPRLWKLYRVLLSSFYFNSKKKGKWLPCLIPSILRNF